MRMKKVSYFFSIFLLTLLSVSLVSALVNPFEPVGELIDNSEIDYIFSDTFSQGVINGNADDIMLARIVIAIILFTILFLLVQAIGKEKTTKKVAFFIALGLTILSVVAIPKAIIISIFATYSAVASIIFFSLPIALVWWLSNYLKQHVQSFRVRHLVTALVSLIMLLILLSFQSALTTQASSSQYFKFLTENGWIDLAIALITIYFFYNLIVGIIGERAGHSSGRSGTSATPTFHTGTSEPTMPRGSSADDAREVSQRLTADTTATTVANADLDRQIESLEQVIIGLEHTSLDDVHQEENYMRALQQAISQLSEQLNKIRIAQEAIAQAQGTPGTEQRIHELQVQVQEASDLFGQRWNELGSSLKQLQEKETAEAQSFGTILDDLKRIAAAFVQKQAALQKIVGDVTPLKQDAEKKKGTGDSKLDRDIASFVSLSNELLDKVKQAEDVLKAEQAKATAVQQEATAEQAKVAQIANELFTFYSAIQSISKYIQEQKYKEALSSFRELGEKVNQLEVLVEQKRAALEQTGVFSTKIAELVQLFGTIKNQDADLMKEVQQLQQLMPGK